MDHYFPIEIQREIISYLPNKINYSLVCKRYNDSIRSWFKLDTAQVIEFIKRYAESTRYISACNYLISTVSTAGTNYQIEFDPKFQPKIIEKLIDHKLIDEKSMKQYWNSEYHTHIPINHFKILSKIFIDKSNFVNYLLRYLIKMSSRFAYIFNKYKDYIEDIDLDRIMAVSYFTETNAYLKNMELVYSYYPICATKMLYKYKSITASHLSIIFRYTKHVSTNIINKHANNEHKLNVILNSRFCKKINFHGLDIDIQWKIFTQMLHHKGEKRILHELKNAKLARIILERSPHLINNMNVSIIFVNMIKNCYKYNDNNKYEQREGQLEFIKEYLLPKLLKMKQYDFIMRHAVKYGVSDILRGSLHN